MRQKGRVCCNRLCGMPSHATPQLASGMSGCVTISLLIYALASRLSAAHLLAHALHAVTARQHVKRLRNQ